MAIAALLTQQAEIQTYTPGLDDYGNESAGTWDVVGTVAARYEELFGIEVREGRNINIMRWRCFIMPTTVSVDDRVRDPDTGVVFGIFAIDRDWGRSELHHLTLWLEQVVE